ncbi:hypothetical protein COCOBI_08-3180 [Coccomyxa sp. Obi]|nr:hypothetical protein COCOBI_08-3180 [Coccomyxa sp. Obi]
MAGMPSMPSMLLLESLFDPPHGFIPDSTDRGKHAHQGPPVSLHANCPPYRPLMESHSQMDNTGFQDPTAGMDPEQHVRWLQATGQESSCADIDSAHNQGIIGSGLECSGNTDEGKSEDPPMSAEELRRQKRRKINRESARRMRLKPRLEVLLSQLTLLQDAYKRLLEDYNTLRQEMYISSDALPQQ